MRKSFVALAGLCIMMACHSNPVQEVPVFESFTPECLLSLGRVSDPQLSPDGKWILYGVNYQNVEKNNSFRSLWVVPADGSKAPVRLAHIKGSASNARWSADGKDIWFLMGGQLWRAPFSDGKSGKPDLRSEVPAGIDGFLLSPDNSKILYVSSIPGPVKSPADADPALSKAQAYVAEDLMCRHWDHWVTSVPRTFVASIGLELVTPGHAQDLLEEGNFYELPTEPFGGTEQLCWSPDSRYVAYSCRKKQGRDYAFSTDAEIYLYEVASGKTARVPMGGGYDTEPVWSPDGKHLAWLSMERDGYEADKSRLMVCEVDFPLVSGIRDLTEGFDRDAQSPLWSEDGSALYFAAEDLGRRPVFRVSLDGGAPEKVAGEGLECCLSPFALYADGLLCGFDSLNRPTEIGFVSAQGLKALTHTNDAILDPLPEGKVEEVWIPTVDGQSLQVWVAYPPEFDASKVWPSILITLGGPQGMLGQDWSYRWNYRLMAAQGYVVVMPNRRGTTAQGQAWKEQISGDYPGLNMQDYLSAARYFKAKPFIGKMAACGASYGGYSVYMLEGLHEDVFDCFIAHAGIFDERYMWYTTEEMWFPNFDNGGLGDDSQVFGGIAQGGAPYSALPRAMRHYANSPESRVTQWHTPILCIHGGKDFRIPYDQGMAAFNAAQMMGVPSKLVVFPEENHWILQPQNALFWHRTYFDWLDKWCK